MRSLGKHANVHQIEVPASLCIILNNSAPQLAVTWRCQMHIIRFFNDAACAVAQVRSNGMYQFHAPKDCNMLRIVSRIVAGDLTSCDAAPQL